MKLPVIIGISAVAVVAVCAFVAVKFLGPTSWDINEKNFPDTVVRDLVVTKLDTNQDGKLSKEEGEAVTSLDLDGATKVENLSTYFPNLQELKVTGTAAAQVDASHLPALESLDVSNSQVQRADTKGSGALKTLNASGSQVSELDVSTNKQLKSLIISNTPMSGIDISDNRDLEEFDAKGTNLGSLDVSSNEKLSKIETDGSTKVTGIEHTQLEPVWLATGISVRRVYADGQTEDTERYEATYDDQQRVTRLQYLTTSSTSGSSNEGLSPAMTYDYMYDDTGNCDRSRYTRRNYKDTSVVNASYTYDDNNRCIAYKSATSNSSYTYDDAGHLTSASQTNATANGSTVTRTYTYDDAGRLIEEKSAGGGSDSITYAYNDQGQCTTRSEHGNTTTYSYDEAGHVTQAQSDGHYDYTVKYDYDDTGRLTKVSSKKNDSEDSETYELSYDDQGRLVKVNESLVFNDSANDYQYVYELEYGDMCTYKGKNDPAPNAGLQLAPTYNTESGGMGSYGMEPIAYTPTPTAPVPVGYEGMMFVYF